MACEKDNLTTLGERYCGECFELNDWGIIN